MIITKDLVGEKGKWQVFPPQGYPEYDDGDWMLTNCDKRFPECPGEYEIYLDKNGNVTQIAFNNGQLDMDNNWYLKASIEEIDEFRENERNSCPDKEEIEFMFNLIKEYKENISL